jgi:hypothetical protein
MVRFFLFFLGLLSFLAALTLGGCAPKGLGTFTVGDQTTVLTHSYAALQSDKNNPKQNIVVVLFADRPVEAADRQPSRLMALTKSKKLHALRLIWRRDTLDDLRVVLYHPEIIASGLAFRRQSVLNITALKDRHIEAEVRSKKLGQDWAFTIKFKADLVKGGVAELEPLAAVDASGESGSGVGKGSGKGSSSQWISELGRLGYEFTNDDFYQAIVEGDLRAMRLFLSAGMSPNYSFARINGRSPLMLLFFLGGACPAGEPTPEATREVVKALIAAGADLNQVDENGNTALMFAARKCDRATIRLLISAGAKIGLRNKGGLTALEMSIVSGNPGVEELIAAGARLDRQEAKDYLEAYKDNPKALALVKKATPQ